MQRVRLKELAEHAGVSLATVDRVLHGRGGYGKRSAERVREAIDILGYGVLPEHLKTATKPHLNFAFLLPDTRGQFVRSIEHEAVQATRQFPDFHIGVSFRFCNIDSGGPMARLLLEINPEKIHGVCVFSKDLPAVSDEIDRLTEAGVHVVTVVADLPSSNRLTYVGLDNFAAGQIAGRLISKLVKEPSGTVGIITGSNMIRDHSERYEGVIQSLGNLAPDLSPTCAYEGHCLNASNAELVEMLYEKHDDLVAIYAVAGGRRGVIQAVRFRNDRKKPVVILHDLTHSVREALIDGTADAVINQNIGNIVKQAYNALIGAVSGRSPQKGIVPIEIYFPENLP